MRRLIQWLMCNDCFDFQFSRTVFFAIVRDMSSGCQFLVGRLICVISPNRQRDGDGGNLQPNILESFFMTAIQKE